MSADSLRKRYFYKLATNFCGLIVGFFTQMVVPRGLGPKSYGDYNFLTSFFAQIIGFLHIGTPMALFTKISQRQKDVGLVAFYSYFVGYVAFVIFAIIAIAQFFHLDAKMWPDQKLSYVYMASFLALYVWVIALLNGMTDAYGLTVTAEKRKFICSLAGLAPILLLFFFKKLNIATYFIYKHVFSLLLIMLFAQLIIRKDNYALIKNWTLTFEETKKYIKEFYTYSHPLFTYSLVGLFVGILDRWLLQYFGGGVQQGFYSLSYQIGAVCFLFTGSMTDLITRDFSVTYANKDLPLMASIFRKHIPLLYAITAFLACFVVVNADKVTLIMGGGKFKEAAGAVAIMALYPIHQTYGHLSNAVYYATGQTKLYRNIGVIFNLISLPLVYFLIAPKELYGINAGANGLAFKMVFINVLAVNVQLYYNARFLKISFWWYLWHQIVCLTSLLALAWTSTLAIRYLLGNNLNAVLGIILSGLLYVIMTVVVVYFYPIIFGLQKQDLKTFVQICVKKFKF